MQKPLPIEFTQGAWDQLMSLKSIHQTDDTEYLRVGIKDASGCQGIFHSLRFEKCKQDNDLLFKHLDQKIIIDNKHLMHLVGLTIDFLNTPSSTGFQFKTNPIIERK